MRKQIAALFLSLLVVTGLSFAQSRQQVVNEFNQELGQFRSLGNQLQTLDNGTGKQLADREENLKATADLLKGAVTNFKTKWDDLGMRIEANNSAADTLKAQEATLGAQISNHNSRCAGTYSDKGYVESCNAEAANLNAQKANYDQQADRITANANSLNQEHADLIQYGQGLKQRYDQLSQDTLDWTAKEKQYRADRNDILAQAHQTLVRLQALANQLSNCVNNLPSDADDEQIKHACGNIRFDGVRANLQRLKDIDPSTIMPQE